MGILIKFTGTVGDRLIVGGGVIPEDAITPLHLADMPRFTREITKQILDAFDQSKAFSRMMIYYMERVPAPSAPMLVMPAPPTDLLTKFLAKRKQEQSK